MTPLYTQEEYDNAKSNDLLKLKCEHCGSIFTATKKLITQEIKHNRGRNKFCSKKCKYEAAISLIETKCSNCGKEITISKSVYEKSVSKHFFCNKSCAASFNNAIRNVSEETKNKIKASVTEYHHLHPKPKQTPHKKVKKEVRYKERICKVCGRMYTSKTSGSTKVVCSKECSEYLHMHHKDFIPEEMMNKLKACGSIGGRNSALIQSSTRRSKNERYFCELCEKHFQNVKHNEPLFNGWDADVIIEDNKTAILWNGKWHYEKITKNHSLEQVQNRDKIKIEEIKKCGYKPYIIKDMGKYNSQFVEKEFEKFLKTI